MPKLIVCMATLSSGGAERVLSILSKSLADRFDSVTYVMWVEASIFYDIDKRVKLVSIQNEIDSKSELKRMHWFRNYVRQEKPDLILSFLEPINLRVLMCTVRLGVKIIVAERNDPRGVNKFWWMNQVEKLIYKRADKILVQTETIRRFFDGSLAAKTYVIYNPVNIPEDLVGKALTTPKKKRIVSVARLMSQKKHDVLIKAFAKFIECHSDYTLTIYGNGPHREVLLKLAETLCISDKVFLPGVSKTVHQDILNADIFCLVSMREGLSNSMIEAMCLGLPCICTKVSGAIDLIQPDVNGILTDIGDIENLYLQMCRLVENKDLCYNLGVHASQLYKIINYDYISKQWIELINDTIKEIK